MSQLVKIVVTVPEKDAAKVRKVIGNADGGKVGNYSHTSFSVKGIGRFKPLKGANPTIGEVGEFEEVAEERIEVTCEQGQVKKIVETIRSNHPYEEPAIDIYPLLLEDE